MTAARTQTRVARALALLCLAVIPGFVAPLRAASASRPNVVFIIVDDLATTLSCYGDTRVRTPNMDRLASQGVRFDRAYCQFALCNPTRASFLTGCYPEATGVFDLVSSFRDALPDVVTLPQWFSDHGYKTGRIGKVFHVPDPKTVTDIEVRAPLAKDSLILDEAKALLKEDDISKPGPRGKFYNRDFAPSLRPDSAFTDHEIADRAIKAMDTLSAGGQPFFLAVGFIRPHTPFVAPERFFTAIDRSRLVLPPYYQERGEDVSTLPQHALRPNNNVFRYRAPTRDDALDGVRAYLASTSFVDAQVGRVMAHIREKGLAENTIIVLTGDHGYQLGEHGLWAKQTLFEGANHVPLIVVAPGVPAASSRALVEQVDIFPTLVELAGLPAPTHLQGRSLKPLLNDPAAPGKRAVFGTVQAFHTKVMGRTVRTDRFRYIAWDDGRGGEQLYDEAVDPDELHNLARDPAHAATIRQLRELLQEHVAAVSVVAKPKAPSAQQPVRRKKRT